VLGDIVDEYKIPFGKFKIVFKWARSSKESQAPAQKAFDQSFVLTCKSQRYHGLDKKVFEGSGRTYLVPDKYYKSGKAYGTLMDAYSYPGYPGWNNLVKDVNQVLTSRPGVVASIEINRMDDLGVVAYHLLRAFQQFTHPHRTFVVVKNVNRNPNRCATFSAASLVDAITNFHDFTTESSLLDQCLHSSYKGMLLRSAGNNRTSVPQPDNEGFIFSQASTQGGSLPHDFDFPDDEDDEDDVPLPTNMELEGKEPEHEPRIFTVGGHIRAEKVNGTWQFPREPEVRKFIDAPPVSTSKNKRRFTGSGSGSIGETTSGKRRFTK
jgi:hypothetical protein